MRGGAEVKYFSLGRAATKGDGPIRYSLRIPVWPGDNVRIEAIENLALGDAHETTIAGQKVQIEKRDHFLILKMQDFPSIQAADAMWSHLSIALIRLSAVTGAALQFPVPLAKIARGDDPNIQFREQIRESEYPIYWTRRSDGTRTDGGIFPQDACILPEHERIWEYSLSFGKIQQIVKLSQVDDFLSESKKFPVGVTEHNAIRMASQALWLACTANDRRIQYVLFAVTLEILAGQEEVPNWATAIPDTMAAIRKVVNSHAKSIPKDTHEKLLNAIGWIGAPTDAERVNGLVMRSFGIHAKNAPEAQILLRELAGIRKQRAKLVHRGGFLTVPTADENERLREIVTKALDQRIRECGV
jgi:hypothetical protein